MSERPILFSASMVRAILDGSKTQTRRIINPQPRPYVGSVLASSMNDKNLRKSSYFDAYCNAERTEANPRRMSENWCWWTPDHRQGPDWIRMPYGKPGDQLWVRETWAVSTWYDNVMPTSIDRGAKVAYAASGGDVGCKRRPSIHMPRWASRIDLEITGIRVERLQEISEADAMAEGCKKVREHCYVFDGTAQDKAKLCHNSPITAFSMLWDEINGMDSWNANPWIWVIEFRRLEREAEQVAA